MSPSRNQRMSRSTLLSLIGLAVAGGAAWADVRSDAKKGAGLSERVRAVEIWQAGDEEWKKAVKKQLDRIEGKLGR